ncbi:MAG: hypothetical protein PHI19_00785 [Clostridia bacterium]|nr:hypothetical protein [Clostridia bacterium]
MNKLEGFLELQTLLLHSVPWKRYTGTETFENDKLWTIRVAVLKGPDFNLPRKVGVSSEEAEAFAKSLLSKLSPDDYIIYYPYFLAEKSGTLEVSYHRTVIEAVEKDLWNLLTYNHRDLTVIEENGVINYYGNASFLSHAETAELLETADYIRRRYKRDYMTNGSMLLEWSYAYESNPNGTPKGARKLIFIELRVVKR